MFSLIQSVGSSPGSAVPGMRPVFDDSIETPTEGEVFSGDRLIPDLVYHIFTFLPPTALARASCVSKVWQDLAAQDSLWRVVDPKQIPRVTVFDQAFWEEFVDLAALGLDFEGLPEVDNSIIIPILRKLLSPGVIEDDAGAGVLIWPNGVDYDKLSTLVQNPKKGHPTKFRDISPETLRALREIPPSRACIFIISNNVLNGSRRKSGEAHKKLVHGIGCEEPQVLPMATLAILTHMSSGTRLYGDKDTCTGCSETRKVGEGECRLFIGAFALAGLNVNIYDFLSTTNGVGAQFKVPAIGT